MYIAYIELHIGMDGSCRSYASPAYLANAPLCEKAHAITMLKADVFDNGDAVIYLPNASRRVYRGYPFNYVEMKES